MNYNELWHRLAQRYDEGEAKAIARMTYDVRYGLTLSDLCLGKGVDSTYDNTPDTLFDNQIGTRRRLAIV